MLEKQMDFSTLGSLVQNPRLFYGPVKKPFLAPRGIFISGQKLFVSDTGQNRVFIWHTLPKNAHQDPDIILGQTEITADGRNANDKVSSQTLHYPSGIWSDGDRLVVADAWNHRVLIWNQMPVSNAQPADIVLGQKDFSQNLPNLNGIQATPTERSMHWPYGVFSDGKSLWVADTGNRRVLFFENFPEENYAPATDVIGKPNFFTKDYSPNDPIWPYSVRVSKNGALAISDTQFYRTLIWLDKETAFSHKADIIIGQENFENSGQNQFRLQPDAYTLNWTYDCFFYKKGIFVNDTGNSRILYFENLPDKNNSSAQNLIGRNDFTTSSEFKGNLMGTNTALYWPFSICVDEQDVYIADTGNHRLVLGNLSC